MTESTFPSRELLPFVNCFHNFNMNQSYLKRLLPFLLPHRGKFAVAVACMVLSGLLSGAFLYLFKQVLSSIIQVDTPDRLQKLLFFMGTVLIWAVARGLVDFWRQYLVEEIWQRVLANLREKLFSHFMQLPMGFFEKQRTGELMSRLTNDLSALQSIMITAIVSMVRSPIEVIVSLGAMFYLNWKLSLWIIVVLPPIAFLTQRAGQRIRRAVGEMQFQLGELTDFFQEKLSAMRLIQTFGTQRHEMQLFHEENEEAFRRSLKPVRIKSSLGPLIDFIAYTGVLIVLVIGVYSGAQPEDLLVFLFAMHRAAMELKNIASINNQLKSGDAAAARLFEMLDTESDIVDAPDAIDLRNREVTGRVTFDNVGFAYNTGPQVLHDISFEIAPGEVVALAGLSGSGKSTIASMVPRLYDPKSGVVRIDGYDLRGVTLESLRANLGTVPQDTTLFHGSVRDNIAYGKTNATDAEVREAAQRANADVFIKNLPQGYDTPVGERGNRLSGGQRQRIAIARALLRDPKVLILDEATSSLDAESERLVQDALDTLMQGRTTLIIAHRFATIWRANKIIVLENGRIAEAGTHTELLARKGLYNKLYQMQAEIGSEENGEQNKTPQLAIGSVA